jgi:NADPH-dependent F420 reductase
MTRIAIVGGTGDLGTGLAGRLAAHYDVTIGSRDHQKAVLAAQNVTRIIMKDIAGLTNEEAVEGADAAILAVPSLAVDLFTERVKAALKGKLVISPIVPIRKEAGVLYYDFTDKSAAERVAEALPESRVVSALHTIPAPRLLSYQEELDYDVLVAADRENDFQEASSIVRSIPRLRPLHSGPLKTSRMIEAITPLLINLGKFSHIRSASLKVV